MRKLLYIFMALALAACSFGSKSEVELNQQKWQNQNIPHYRFNLFLGCFCIFNENMPLIIEVQNDEVVSMEYQNGKEIDPNLLDLFNKYATIDRIFAELDKNIKGEADEVVAKYDVTYGFPTQVNIDFIKEAVDDELALTVSNFEKLP